MTVYPLSAVRTLALYTEGLTRPIQADITSTLSDIQKTVERLGCVQIDTLNLVQRSHYLVLWSRLGVYNPTDFDSLVYSTEHRSMFEGWQRVASIIPLKDYRYQLPRMQRMRQNHSEGFLKWFDQEACIDGCGARAHPNRRSTTRLILSTMVQEGAAGGIGSPPRLPWNIYSLLAI